MRPGPEQRPAVDSGPDRPYFPQMLITVKCFATLAPFQPRDSEAYPVNDGETAGDVIARLGIAPGDVAVLFVNGVHAAPGRVLAEGDRLGLFPAVGGG